MMARETVQNGAEFHRVILAWMDDSNVLYFCVLAWRDECELYRRSPMWPYLLFGYDEVRRVWCSVCIRQRRRKGMPGTYTGTGTHRGGVEPPRGGGAKCRFADVGWKKSKTSSAVIACDATRYVPSVSLPWYVLRRVCCRSGP